MNNYREVELLAKKSVGDSGTETVDINTDEPITELSVRLYVQNDTAQADEVPPESCVSKIEIVDGGQVYMSLNGREATAVAWYEKGYWPKHWYSAVLSETSYTQWPFQFGRYLGDPEYALSPTKLLNPQIKITWAKNALHLADSVTLEVNARTMQGVTAPGKALFTKAIKSWTTASSGIVEVDLPTDYPYRRLYARAYGLNEWLGSLWTNLRLECDVGKLVVFDWEDDEMMELMSRLWGPVHYTEYIVIDDAEIHQTHLGFCDFASFDAFVASVYCQGSPTAPGYVRTWARAVTDGAAQNDVKTCCLFRGLLPENTYCYPFGRQDEPDTWFPAPSYGSVKLKITEGTAGADASVLVQQPRRVP